MVCGEIPPTASRRVPFGRTARMALTPAGEAISAGNSFSASAPASSASKASDTVKKPGSDSRPFDLLARITSISVLGETITVPPASATRSTSLVFRTVPAPTSALPSRFLAKRRIEVNGSGEFSGTSMMPMPATTIASAIASTSSGVTPRRIATNGMAASAESRVRVMGVSWDVMSEVGQGEATVFMPAGRSAHHLYPLPASGARGL